MGGLLPNVSGFIESIGGMPKKNKVGERLNDANILEQGTFVCQSNSTANLPSEATGVYVLINFQGGLIDSKAYFVQFLFGLNTLKRYTRLKIDVKWMGWSEF